MFHSVLCAKGIERDTGTLLSDIAGQILPDNPVAALSGPSFATDVAGALARASSTARASCRPTIEPA